MSWTKEDQARLRTLHTKQLTVKEIAKEMQKPQELIRSELKAMGYKPIEQKEKPESDILKGFKPVEIPKRGYTKITPEIEKRVCELRERCFTTAQIADKLHIRSDETVRNILKRNGYSTKRGEFHKQDAAGQTGTKKDKPKPAQINKEFDAAVDQMIAEAEIKKEENEMTLNEAFKDIDKRADEIAAAVGLETKKEPAPAATDTSSKEVINDDNHLAQHNNTTDQLKSQALNAITVVSMLETMLSEWLGNEAETTYIQADRELGELRFEFEGREYSFEFFMRGKKEGGR